MWCVRVWVYRLMAHCTLYAYRNSYAECVWRIRIYVHHHKEPFYNMWTRPTTKIHNTQDRLSNKDKIMFVYLYFDKLYNWCCVWKSMCFCIMCWLSSIWFKWLAVSIESFWAALTRMLGLNYKQLQNFHCFLAYKTMCDKRKLFIYLFARKQRANIYTMK